MPMHAMIGGTLDVLGLEGTPRQLPLQALEEAVRSTVPKGTEELNLRALRRGYDFGREQQPEATHGPR